MPLPLLPLKPFLPLPPVPLLSPLLLGALRLVLGERLDVDVIGNEALEDLPDEDERVGMVELYEWLGWLLEELVAAAMPGLPDGDDDR